MKRHAKWFQTLSLLMTFLCILPGQPAVAQTATSSTTAEQPEETEEPEASTSLVDQAFYILIDWGGGLLGLTEAPGVLLTGLGAISAAYGYLKELKVKQQERNDNEWDEEDDRRRTEKRFIGTLKQARYGHLFAPDHFKRPVFYGADMAAMDAAMESSSASDTLPQPMVAGSQPLLQQLREEEQAQYELFQSVRSPEPDIQKINKDPP